ncbi:Tn3 family transposase [Streptomyces sp. NPDC002039]|uniref:Tn3 family transposase n=1 Tax=Streptomyces sp. NPDC002039 TaxID=3154660 RepID=UPI0033237973
MADYSFLTAEQAARYGAFPEVLSQADLDRYFVLNPDDLALATRRRGAENKLGYAAMRTGLRMCGRFPDPGEVPASAAAFLSRQLNVDPSALADYGTRDGTVRIHRAEIKKAGGWKDFDEVREKYHEWLTSHVWNTGGGPTALFYALIRELRDNLVVLPGLSTLTRLVGTVRSSDMDRVCRTLTAGLKPPQVERLDRLLLVPEGANSSELSRARRRPHKGNDPDVTRALERALAIRQWGLHDLDVAQVPMRRVAQLARPGEEARISRTERRSPLLKRATTVATVVRLGTTSVDDAIDLFQAHMATNLLAHARTAARKAREERWPELACALDTLARLGEKWCTGKDELIDTQTGEVLDGERSALDHYARLEHSLPCQEIAAATAIAREFVAADWDPDEAWRVQLIKQFRKVQPFLPVLPLAVEFGATAEGSPVLAALKSLPALMQLPQAGAQDIDPSLLTGSWRRLVLADPRKQPGSVHLEAYAMCVLTQLHDLLDSHDIYARRSSKWGNPDARLLRGQAWDLVKPAILTDLRLPEQPQELLSKKSAELDRRFREVRESLPDNSYVEVSRRGKLRVTKSESAPALIEATALQDTVCAALPRVDLPEALLAVLTWIKADRICTSATGALPPGKDFNVTLAALLVAYGCNVGYELVTGSGPLSSNRLKEVDRDYLTPHNIKALASRMIDLQRAIPLAQLMGGGEVAAVDGIRFSVPSSSPFGRPGAGSGTTATWFTLVTDQAASLAGMVVAGSPRASLYVLDVLGDRDEGGPSMVVADTGPHADIVFGLLTLAGYLYAPQLADIPDTTLWRTESAADYGPLKTAAPGLIDTDLIARHWPRILKVIGSIHHGTVRAQDVIRMLTRGSHDSLGQAIAHYGRIAKSMHILRLLDDPAYRTTIRMMTTRQHDRQGLARRIHHGRDGQSYRYHPGMEQEVGALGLLLNALVLHTTHLMDGELAHLRADGHHVRPDIAGQLSPFSHDHINFGGRYTFQFDNISEGPRIEPGHGVSP